MIRLNELNDADRISKSMSGKTIILNKCHCFYLVLSFICPSELFYIYEFMVTIDFSSEHENILTSKYHHRIFLYCLYIL